VALTGVDAGGRQAVARRMAPQIPVRRGGLRAGVRRLRDDDGATGSAQNKARHRWLASPLWIRVPTLGIGRWGVRTELVFGSGSGTRGGLWSKSDMSPKSSLSIDAFGMLVCFPKAKCRSKRELLAYIYRFSVLEICRC